MPTINMPTINMSVEKNQLGRQNSLTGSGGIGVIIFHTGGWGLDESALFLNL